VYCVLAFQVDEVTLDLFPLRLGQILHEQFDLFALFSNGFALAFEGQ